MKRWLSVRLRLWAIYRELGYIPWKKPAKPRKEHKGVYMGTKEVIPFMNEDAKRTISHLLLRPGYMLRDYIFRGQHERYLSPITALLVFYSLFTLLVAVVNPTQSRKGFGDGILEAMKGDVTLNGDFDLNGTSVQLDSTDLEGSGGKFAKTLLRTVATSMVYTHLDLYPEAVDAPWKESLAAIEGDLRGKGIPMFLSNFLMLWLAMTWLLKKKHGVSVSGAAAASGYVLCQFCVFMFLALLFSLGQKTEIGMIVMGILLFIDYRQWLGIKTWPAVKLTVKTGLVYALVCTLFYLFISLVLILFALLKS